MEDKISIIVPVYNVKEYVNKCLESIRNQTYKNLEVIVVNDGSTDGSEKICKSFIKKDERFIYYSTANYGVSHARNVGLDKATGKYVIFIDSDDWLEKDMIEELYKVITENSCDIAICDYFINIKDVQIEHNDLKKENIIDKKRTMFEFLFNSKLYGGYLWNKLIKKDIIGNIKFDVNIKIEEDVEFFCRVFENVQKIIYVPQKKLYHYVKRKESAVNFNYTEKDLTKLLALEKIMNIKLKYKIENLDRLEYEYYIMSRQSKYILKKYNIKNKKINQIIREVRKRYLWKALNESTFLEKIKLIILTIMPITYGKIMNRKINIKN